MNRAHVRKAAAGSHHGERGAGPAAEEEKPGLGERRLLLFLTGRVEIDKDAFALAGIVDQAIETARHVPEVNCAVIGQQRADIAQLHSFVVAAIIPRQQEKCEARECGVLQQIAQRVAGAEVPICALARYLGHAPDAA